jgi:prefoldin beta subunit
MESEEKLAQLQMIEQNMQQFLVQKQQYQGQLIELESALKETEGKEKAYKIIGNIMVSTDAEELRKELKEKKEMIDLRLKSLDKQEKLIKERAQKLQAEIMEEMEKK